jgi:hypothetical protein
MTRPKAAASASLATRRSSMPGPGFASSRRWSRNIAGMSPNGREAGSFSGAPQVRLVGVRAEKDAVAAPTAGEEAIRRAPRPRRRRAARPAERGVEQHRQVGAAHEEQQAVLIQDRAARAPRELAVRLREAQIGELDQLVARHRHGRWATALRRADATERRSTTRRALAPGAGERTGARVVGLSRRPCYPMGRECGGRSRRASEEER